MNYSKEFAQIFKLQRKIFFVCPSSRHIVRLSTCHISSKKKADLDWLSKIEKKESTISKKECEWKEKGIEEQNKRGRTISRKLLTSFDNVFRPNKLSVEEAFIVGHPIDYVAFNGLKNQDVKDVVFLNKKGRKGENELRASIKKAIKEFRYRWATFRIDEKTKRVIEEE